MASPALSPERVKTLRSAGTGAAGIPPQLVREVGVLGFDAFDDDANLTGDFEDLIEDA